ncbi:MAG: hypothetical protein AB8C40_07745 [Gammaproteobacteria bacterium]
MKKVKRLEKLYKLLKIQEQDILAEFKQLQNTSHQIKMQIKDLADHSSQSAKNLKENPIAVSQLTLSRKFNQKIELVIEQLQVRLSDNDKNFLIVADKVKQLRTSLTSIERLKNKHQLLEDYEQENFTQKQIEENINFTVSSRE